MQNPVQHRRGIGRPRRIVLCLVAALVLSALGSGSATAGPYRYNTWHGPRYYWRGRWYHGYPPRYYSPPPVVYFPPRPIYPPPPVVFAPPPPVVVVPLR